MSSSSSSIGSSSDARISCGRTASISSSGDGSIDSCASWPPIRCSASTSSASSSPDSGACAPALRIDGGESSIAEPISGIDARGGGVARAPGRESGDLMLGGGREGCTEGEGRDDGNEGGGVVGRDTGWLAPPVRASTFRSSAGISTGRGKKPLPSLASASSIPDSTPPAFPRNTTSIASASESSRTRPTASIAPSASESTRITFGRCTATRATSIESGTSTTEYPAPRSACATRSASADGSLTKTVTGWGPRLVSSSGFPLSITPRAPRAIAAPNARARIQRLRESHTPTRSPTFGTI